jgi:hypothetical protein
LAASSQFPFWLGYIINMPGSNFRKRHLSPAASIILLTLDRVIGPPRSLAKTKAPSALRRSSRSAPKLITLDWVNASDAALQSPDVEMCPSEVDLIPLKVNSLTDAQTMASH